MWISDKAVKKDHNEDMCTVGCVSIGGMEPSVLTDGELRNAEFVGDGAVRIPKIGDEVLVVHTAYGDTLVVGSVKKKSPKGLCYGEIYISSDKGGSIVLRNDGEIKLSGDVVIEGSLKVSGRTEILGELIINGQPYIPNTGGDGSGT